MPMHIRPLKGHYREKEKPGQKYKGEKSFHVVCNLLALEQGIG